MTEQPPAMKGLSQEAIAALLKPKATTGKRSKVRERPLPLDPLIRQQIGPIRFVQDRGYCVSGHWSEEFQQRFECRCPTYTQFQGVYYCNTHALHLANQMLVAKGVVS